MGGIFFFKATCKRDQRLAALNSHYVRMQKKKEEETNLFEENTKWLHRVENEMRLLGQEGCIPKVKCLSLCHGWGWGEELEKG